MNYLQFGVSALVMLCLPGLAIQAWIEPRLAALWGWLADGIGLSIALTVLLGQLFFWLVLPPGGWGLAVFYGLGLLVALAALLSGRCSASWRQYWPAWAAGLLLLAALLGFRFLQASGLAFPNWVDSVHHTLIVRKMVEYGGIPPDLSPYLDAPFYYHYGFHLLAAIFAALSSLPADQSVLWLGQIIAALVSLSIFRLGMALKLGGPAALLAALLPGFVFYMPGYYLSWGRYPLLSGLVLLPLAMAGVIELLEQPRNKKLALRLGLLTAGLCLTHYLALLFFLLFLVVVAIEQLLAAARRRDWNGLPWLAGGAILTGGLAALPWLARMLLFNSASIKVGEVKVALKASDFNGLLNMLRPEYDLRLMAVAAFCLILGLLRLETRRIAIWGALLLFFALPFAPQPGPFRQDLFAIVLFLPAGLLLGWGLARGAESLAGWLCRRRPDPDRLRTWLGQGLTGGALALLLALGVTQTRSVVNSSTTIADAADRRALEWIAANTPGEARFFINATLWSGVTYRGVDGGYWILPFTGRFGLVPPVVYEWMDKPQAEQVRDWAKRASAVKGCTPDFWALVREANLGYVYVRKDKGSLQPEALADCPRLKQIYQQDGIGIFEILRP